MQGHRCRKRSPSCFFIAKRIGYCKLNWTFNPFFLSSIIFINRIFHSIFDMFQQSKWGLITEIVDKISSECFKDGKFLDLNEPSLVHKAGEKIRCTIGAISEALKDTEFSPIWEETKKELEELHKRIADCKKLTSNLAVTKYVFSSSNYYYHWLFVIRQ